MNAQTTQTNAQMDAHANVHASAHIYAQMNACSLHACGLCAQFHTRLPMAAQEPCEDKNEIYQSDNTARRYMNQINSLNK